MLKKIFKSEKAVLNKIRVIKIADLNSTEAQHVFAVRKTVFVDEQKVDHNLEYDAHEKTATHYLAYCDEKPCGAARFRKTDKGIKLERFAVLKEYRGKQVGLALLKKVMEDVIPLKQKIYLHAQISAHGFYLKNGFEEEGKHFYEANIEHVIMVYQFKNS